MADQFEQPLQQLGQAATLLEDLGMPAKEILENVNDSLEKPVDLSCLED